MSENYTQSFRGIVWIVLHKILSCTVWELYLFGGIVWIVWHNYKCQMKHYVNIFNILQILKSIWPPICCQLNRRKFFKIQIQTCKWPHLCPNAVETESYFLLLSILLTNPKLGLKLQTIKHVDIRRNLTSQNKALKVWSNVFKIFEQVNPSQ